MSYPTRARLLGAGTFWSTNVCQKSAERTLSSQSLCSWKTVCKSWFFHKFGIAFAW